MCWAATGNWSCAIQASADQELAVADTTLHVALVNVSKFAASTSLRHVTSQPMASTTTWGGSRIGSRGEPAGRLRIVLRGRAQAGGRIPVHHRPQVCGQVPGQHAGTAEPAAQSVGHPRHETGQQLAQEGEAFGATPPNPRRRRRHAAGEAAPPSRRSLPAWISSPTAPRCW